MVVGELELSQFLFSDLRLAQNPCKNSSTKIVKVNFMEPERTYTRWRRLKVEFICANSFTAKTGWVFGKHNSLPERNALLQLQHHKIKLTHTHTRQSLSRTPPSKHNLCVTWISCIHTKYCEFCFGNANALRHSSQSRALTHWRNVVLIYKMIFKYLRCYPPAWKRCQRTPVFVITPVMRKELWEVIC